MMKLFAMLILAGVAMFILYSAMYGDPFGLNVAIPEIPIDLEYVQEYSKNYLNSP